MLSFYKKIVSNDDDDDEDENLNFKGQKICCTSLTKGMKNVRPIGWMVAIMNYFHFIF